MVKITINDQDVDLGDMSDDEKAHIDKLAQSIMDSNIKLFNAIVVIKQLNITIHNTLS